MMPSKLSSAVGGLSGWARTGAQVSAFAIICTIFMRDAESSREINRIHQDQSIKTMEILISDMKESRLQERQNFREALKEIQAHNIAQHERLNDAVKENTNQLREASRHLERLTQELRMKGEGL